MNSAKLLIACVTLGLLSGCKGVINSDQIEIIFNICNNNGGLVKIVAEQSVSADDKVYCADGARYDVSSKGVVVK